ncbi:helix-turn-helix transcriptional regulator [Marilutibacter maris]|uniref:AraC family transcription regulator protein n=1 Tax=Marilutibacter maris TaxID=1605891 RepID=A0A2U9TC73_9GAMM|nr:AraC family transcriptional regulator [Lysobacter maris]AWV08444.1 AraC family transcription regulator protein [Lysobacter maris]KAB8198335.1 helix-turn-helix domain-containing protein [Lysobacter maris]
MLTAAAPVPDTPPAAGVRHQRNHRDDLVSGRRLHARKSHALRNVGVPQLLIVGVEEGHKRVYWHERQYRGGRDDLILLRPGERYGIDNRPGAHGYRAELIQLSPALVADFRRHHGGLIDAALQDTAEIPISVHRDRHTGQAWQSLLAAIEEGAPAPLLDQHARTLLLCLTLAGAARALLPGREAPLIQRVRQLLNDDPGRNWNIDELSNLTGMAASTLRRHLSAQDQGFRTILEDARLSAALDSLQSTRDSIGHIAHAVGYASPSRFAIRFRRRFGISPSELRAAL